MKKFIFIPILFSVLGACSQVNHREPFYPSTTPYLLNKFDKRSIYRSPAYSSYRHSPYYRRYR